MMSGYQVINDLAVYACKGQQDAVDLCNGIYRLCQFFDDVYDKDEISKEDHKEALNSFIRLLGNPFLARYSASLMPLCRLIAANWRTANTFEDQKESIDKSFMLRAQVYNLFVLCALFTGGEDWADHISEVAWKTYGESADTLKKEIENA